MRIASLTISLKTLKNIFAQADDNLTELLYKNQCLGYITDFPENFDRPINTAEVSYDNVWDVWQDDDQYEFNTIKYVQETPELHLVWILKNPSTSMKFKAQVIDLVGAEDSPIKLSELHISAIQESLPYGIFPDIGFYNAVYRLLDRVTPNGRWDYNLRKLLHKLYRPDIQRLHFLKDPMKTAKRWEESSTYREDLPSLVTLSVMDLKSLPTHTGLFRRKHELSFTLLGHQDKRYRFAAYKLARLSPALLNEALDRDGWSGFLWLIQNHYLWSKKWARRKFYDQLFLNHLTEISAECLVNEAETRGYASEIEKHLNSKFRRLFAFLNKDYK